MLTPEYLDDIGNAAIELYTELDERIARDIARRLVKSGAVTSTAQWQALMMEESGVLYDDVIAMVAQYSDAAESQVRTLFEDAGVKAVDTDLAIYQAAGLSAPPLRMSPAALRVLNAGLSKTNGHLRNLTMTTASQTQQAFIRAVTMAEMQVESGAFDYVTAVRRAVRDAAGGGAWASYPSGARSRLDVAARRAVLTGVGQTTGQICLGYALDMGCDIMEITAHVGARPGHALWQGGHVSLSGRSGYLSRDDIGYGTGDGFKGWGCRHDWFPYFEGLSRSAYPKSKLDEYRNKTVSFDGKEIPYYDATQRQRAAERAIRDTKRQLAGIDEAIREAQREDLQRALQDDFSAASVKLKRQEAALADFLRQTGLDKDSARMQVAGFGHSQAQKAVWANKKVFTGTSKRGIISMGSDGVQIKIDSLTPCLVDASTGKIVETSFARAAKAELRSLKRRNWLFDWDDPALKDDEIFKLVVKGGSAPQGLIALRYEAQSNAVYVHIAESAPNNRGENRAYLGVGGHLFAIAAQMSMEKGFGGFVYFDAKNVDLVKHYTKALGAQLLGIPHPYRMILDEDAAQKLLKIYTFGKE